MRRALAVLALAAPLLCSAQDGAGPLSAWRAGVDAVGPIHLGMSLDQARRASGLDWQEQPQHGGGWQACHYAWPNVGGQLQLDFGLRLERGTVTRIDVATADVATRSGLRVGDGEAQVVQTYAGKVQVSDEDGARELLVFGDQPRQLLFRLEAGHVCAYRVGLREAMGPEGGCA